MQQECPKTKDADIWLCVRDCLVQKAVGLIPGWQWKHITLRPSSKALIQIAPGHGMLAYPVPRPQAFLMYT